MIETNQSLVLRTDFSDEAAWQSICAEIEKPTPYKGFQFRANVDFVSSPEYAGQTGDKLMTILTEGSHRWFAFVVDQIALSHPEHPILVIDLGREEHGHEPGRKFRVIPSEMWSVENNLSLANMDFRDFADGVDANGIFRGFPETPL